MSSVSVNGSKKSEFMWINNHLRHTVLIAQAPSYHLGYLINTFITFIITSHILHIICMGNEIILSHNKKRHGTGQS